MLFVSITCLVVCETEIDEIGLALTRRRDLSSLVVPKRQMRAILGWNHVSPGLNVSVSEGRYVALLV